MMIYIYQLYRKVKKLFSRVSTKQINTDSDTYNIQEVSNINLFSQVLDSLPSNIRINKTTINKINNLYNGVIVGNNNVVISSNKS